MDLQESSNIALLAFSLTFECYLADLKGYYTPTQDNLEDCHGYYEIDFSE